MREKIALPGDYIGGTQRSPSAQKATKQEDDAAAYEILLLSKIKTAILVHKYLANVWLKVSLEIYQESFYIYIYIFQSLSGISLILVL